MLSLLQSAAVLLAAGPVAARFRERSAEMFGRLVVAENLCVVLGGLSLLQLERVDPSDAGLQTSPWYWAGVLLLCGDAVCSEVLGTVVSKDWVAKAFTEPNELREANAWVTRVDLCTSVGTFLALGGLLDEGTWLQGVAAPAVLLLYHAAAAAANLALGARLARLVPALEGQAHGSPARAQAQQQDSWSVARASAALPRGRRPALTRRRRRFWSFPELCEA